MKNIKLLIDKYIFTKFDKHFPRLYRFLTLDLYSNIYTPIINKIRYKDKYFFNEVIIEINTYCNRKCDYCPNKYQESPKNYMSEDVFYRIIEQLKIIKFSGIIRFSFFNEPLFDERYVKFAEYIKKELPNAVQVVVSNGDLLTVEKALQLEKAGIDKFVITIHDKNPERAYERLSKVKDVLKHKIRIQTQKDLSMQNVGGSVDVSKYKNKKNKKCPHPFVMTITYNGDVVLCCADFYRKYVYGNIMQDTIVNIWNKNAEIRKELLDDNYARYDICKKCLEIE
ncbi:radical SAM superfamily [Brachyspira hampsonii]|uniref:Radical SAM superfamily n=1 Tax=Brachyspira hampsonii TaxID=1287055 RepID=A0A1E5NIB5_9SPIR|nr:radical SAM/SPASM domain-containing protein [Brachyspira hampsonii]OEJ15807.1 radical SAM superfamily [Brachyspira hampsonii]